MKKTLFTICCCFAILSTQAQFRVVGYLANWSAGYPGNINSVDLTKVTHINIAFANPNSSGVINFNTTNVGTIVTACHAANVKVLLSIGGAGANATRYGTLLASNSSADAFIINLVNYVTTNNLDGLDVDIEGDVLNGTNVTAARYEYFVTALATALHSNGKIMTAALATWFGNYVTNTAAAQFDFINVMSYDYTLPGQTAGPVAPYSQMTSDYNYWHNTKAVPAAKLVIGLPFYGYGFGTYAMADEISYCDIISTYTVTDADDMVGSGANSIRYNGVTTIKSKTTYALANASGVMIWQITEDCATTNSHSLLLAISQTVTTAPVAAPISVNSINVFPNPAQDKIMIEGVNMEEGDIVTLTDISGKVVFSQAWTSGSLDISQLNQGLYIVSIRSDKGVYTTRIQKI
jgi:chitinase